MDGTFLIAILRDRGRAAPHRRGLALACAARMGPERRAIRIRGIVQGVGFRPAMHRLADLHGIGGLVRNDREGVWLEIEGPPATLDRFVAALGHAAPPAARIDAIEVSLLAPRAEREFRIAESPPHATGVAAGPTIPADLAPCPDCLCELADPADRRHRYPFINCTACGPRFTIVREVPYDRPATTMAAFEMCKACRREYEDPADRRFHAEPIACPACGPRLALVTRGRTIEEGDAALRTATKAISRGAIVAIKGAGGFVLVVDATNQAAVTRLRERKRRPHRPFAVMARSLAVIEAIAEIDATSRDLLVSPARPIVLVPLRRRDAIARAVAPGLGDLGLYLAPTPLQHLLLVDGPALQVMTSGNLAEEPIARTNEEAFARLGDVADLFLVHDRAIHARADDSVTRAARPPIPIRRARGRVPDAIALPTAGPDVLAVGGHERNTVCLVRDGRAVLSQHVGDLDHPDADAFFREAIAHLQRLLDVAPDVVAHDLHPDYRSTRWALASELPRLAIQHHHAHVAACLAEHGRCERVTGVAFDGLGLGADGTLWGGEILEADLGSCVRRGHLRPIALAGGEHAIRQPWRLAVAALVDAGEPLHHLEAVTPEARASISGLLGTALPSRASSAGRWFDAIAALLGVAHEISYDGQAAAELEALAADGDHPPFELDVSPREPFEIDLRPAIRELVHALARGVPRPVLAARFHATLAIAIRTACRRCASRTVVLTGGCFQNRRLVTQAATLLERDGFEVLVHQRVPPNDGGLALGQAAIASHLLARRSPACA
jgi:hydrogenase maturation protein HypF